MLRKIVRFILTTYYNVTGWFYYMRYFVCGKNKSVVFHSKALHKDMMHIYDKTFMTEYQCTFMGGWHTTQKQITLTYKDIGMYKFNKKETDFNPYHKFWFNRYSTAVSLSNKAKKNGNMVIYKVFQWIADKFWRLHVKKEIKRV